MIEKFGVPPEKVIEVQALIGDSTDNVPGVPGIGVKTAAQLINEYGDLDTLLARAGEIKQQKRREALIDNAEQARMSKRLVTLDDNVPLDVPLDRPRSCTSRTAKRLIAFLKAMEFNTPDARVAEQIGSMPARRSTAGMRAAPGGIAAHRPPPRPRRRPAAADPATAARRAAGRRRCGRRAQLDPPCWLRARRPRPARAKIDRRNTRRSRAARSSLDRRGSTRGRRDRRETPRPIRCRPSSSASRWRSRRTRPATCRSATRRRRPDAAAASRPTRSRADEALAALKPLLEDPAVLKIGQNLKQTRQVLLRARHRRCADRRHHADVLRARCRPRRPRHGRAGERAISATQPIAYKDVPATARPGRFDQVPLEIARAAYAAEDADVTLRLWQALKPRLVAERVATVYETLERPLLPVLAAWSGAASRSTGSAVALSGEFAQRMAALEAEIHELAGEPVQPRQPQAARRHPVRQDGPAGRHQDQDRRLVDRRRRARELAEQGHELPRKDLDWRQLTKLQVDLHRRAARLRQPDTARAHLYALAATHDRPAVLVRAQPAEHPDPHRGRPQDPPGLHRRAGQQAGLGRLFADRAAAARPDRRHPGAAQGLPRRHRHPRHDGVGDVRRAGQGHAGDVRRRAKAINFGIIYGISAFGLANQLGIAREEAGAYIKKYFERFPGIRDYMEETKALRRAHGYVTTLFGRKCHYPDINAKNPSLRAFNERAAINAPLQGSAADIIRRAMIRMEPALPRRSSARMLLQVHDELIFEVPDHRHRSAPVPANLAPSLRQDRLRLGGARDRADRCAVRHPAARRGKRWSASTSASSSCCSRSMSSPAASW